MQSLVHVSLGAHSGACTILLSSVRSLCTLWSLVCAKGGNREVSQERGAEISKALWEHQRGAERQAEPTRDQRKENARGGLPDNNRSRIRSQQSQNQRVGGE